MMLKRQPSGPLWFLVIPLVLVSVACKSPIDLLKNTIIKEKTPIPSVEDIVATIRAQASTSEAYNQVSPIDPSPTQTQLQTQAHVPPTDPSPTQTQLPTQSQATSLDLSSLVQRLVLPEIESLEADPNSDEEITEPHIDLPQLNIDSEDARQYNTAMQEFAHILAEEFTAYPHYASYIYMDVRYEAFLNDDILSVVVESKRGHFNYLGCIKAFNINVRTGKAINGFELLENAGWAQEDVAEQMDALFKKRHDVAYENEEQASARDYDHRMKTYNWSLLYGNKPPFMPIETSDRGSSLQYLYPEHSVVEGQNINSSVYLNQEGKPVYLIQLFGPGDSGNMQARMEREEAAAKAPDINPAYATFVMALGINPEAENAPLMLSAFVGHLGGDDEDEMLGKMEAFFAQFGYEKPYLKQVVFKPGSEDHLIEVFLLLPKNEGISLFLSEENKTDQFDAMINLAQVKTLAPMAISADGVIWLRYHNVAIDYQPKIKGDEGQNSVPVGILDFSRLLKAE